MLRTAACDEWLWVPQVHGDVMKMLAAQWKAMSLEEERDSDQAVKGPTP